MCLHSIVKTFGNSKFAFFSTSTGDFPVEVPRFGLGYKITCMDADGRRTTPHYDVDDEPYIQNNQWYIAKQEIVQTESGYWYPSGFHIFLRLKDAVDFSKYITCGGNTIELISYRIPICAGFERRNRMAIGNDIFVNQNTYIPVVVCENIMFHYPVAKFYLGQVTVYENRSPHNVEGNWETIS